MPNTSDDVMKKILEAASLYSKMLDEDGEYPQDPNAQQVPMDPAAMAAPEGAPEGAPMDPAAMAAPEGEPAPEDPAAMETPEEVPEDTPEDTDSDDTSDDETKTASSDQIADAIKNGIEEAKKSGKKVEIKFIIEEVLKDFALNTLLDESKKDKKLKKLEKAVKETDATLVLKKPSAAETKKYKKLKAAKDDGEKLSKEDKSFIKEYEARVEGLKKMNSKKLNESLIDAIHILSDKVEDLQEQLNTKKNLEKQLQESRCQEIQMNKLNKYANDTVNKVKALYENADSLVSTGKLLSESKTLSYYKNIMNESADMISAISEASSKAVDNFGYTKATVDSKLEESAIKQLNDLNTKLQESSAFSDTQDGYSSIIPEGEFKVPTEAMKHTMQGSAGSKTFSDTNEGYTNESMQKYMLPIMDNWKETKLTLTSAFSKLAEAFTVDGVLDIEGVKPAFLHCSKVHPSSINDFKFPIATIQEGKMVAVPSFIETAASLLAKPDKLATIYKIPLQEHTTMRETIRPYLEQLEMEIPWEK